MRHKYLRESSRLNSGLSKHLIESCNKFLNEDEEEEVFFDPNQEDMFGKSGMNDKPRSGKEFQAPSIENSIEKMVKLLGYNREIGKGVRKALRDFVEEEVYNNELLAKQFVADPNVNTSKISTENKKELIDNILAWVWQGGEKWIADGLFHMMFDEYTPAEQEKRYADMIKTVEAKKFDEMFDHGNIVTAFLEFVPKKETLASHGYLTNINQQSGNDASQHITIEGNLLSAYASDSGDSEQQFIDTIKSLIPEGIVDAEIHFNRNSFVANLTDRVGNNLNIDQDGEFRHYDVIGDFERPQVTFTREMSGSDIDISDLYVAILNDGMKSYASDWDTSVEQNGSFPFLRGDDIYNLDSVLEQLGLRV